MINRDGDAARLDVAATAAAAIGLTFTRNAHACTDFFLESAWVEARLQERGTLELDAVRYWSTVGDTVSCWLAVCTLAPPHLSVSFFPK